MSADLRAPEVKGLSSIAKAYEELLAKRPGMLASESGGELSWLKTARDRDALRWTTEGLPSRKSERWHYTSLAQVDNAQIVLADSQSLKTKEHFHILNIKPYAEIVFLNGHFSRELSRLPSVSDGEAAHCSISVLSELFEECVNNGWSAERKHQLAAFQSHLEASDADRETIFAAMNTSFMQDAVLIHVHAGARIEPPVVVQFLSSAAQTALTLPMTSPRVFAHLDAQTEASIVELFEGDLNSAPYLTNSVSDLRLEEGARLTHCRVQLESAKALHFGTTRIHQKRASFAETFQFSFGAKLARQDLHVSLEGEGAEAVLDGLYQVSGSQHTDHYTLVDHVVPNTTSDQIYKGILDQESRAVFNGHVRIKRDAQKSNAGQKNHNLILSKKAEVDTKPELEIEADDVKASHGATIGQLDPEQIFYFQARGIAEAEAANLLARGFAMDIVFRIRNESVRKCLASLVEERFDLLSKGGSDGL
jgi:Fe-S cluster assembly protein SufD